MDAATKNAAIAAGAIGLGAIVTALASAFSARQKIREIQVQYEHKLQESYLASARQYTNALYVPLSIALEGLRGAYEDFRLHVDFKLEVVASAMEVTFRAAINDYLSEVDAMMARGADAFMTLALEDELRSFTSFVKNSREAASVQRRMILEFGRGRLETRVGGWFARLGAGSVVWGLGGMSFGYRVTEVLAAPIASREFEEQLLASVRILKRLIKDVTLGVHTRPVP